MKKFFKLLIITLLVLTFIKFDAFAASTPTPTPANIQDQIDELKNKIASKVAELKLVEKRGIIGIVTNSSDTQITISDPKGDTRFVDVDELTKFYSSNNSFGISDVKKNMTIGVLGLYNKQSRRILAREINDIPAMIKIVYGGIGSIDKQNFEITVVKENEAKVVIKVEEITKTYSYSSETLEKSGFSKMKETQTIMVIGFPDKLDPNKLLATRILIFPQIDITSRINLGAAINPTIPPSTGSGKKLYPITK